MSQNTKVIQFESQQTTSPESSQDAEQQIGNPEFIVFEGKQVNADELLRDYKRLREQEIDSKTLRRKAIRKYKQEQELRPYQAEIIKLQQYLEESQKRMIILFEGRDAAGKSGVIRRVSRFMNEKHYRVVALGKPTEEQKTQWFFQKYTARFPTGGEIVLFDRSWYTRAMTERVFGFCTETEYKNFMRGVVGFEKDLVRQGTILLKLYFSVTKEEQARRFERRQMNRLKQWKLSEIDLQAQDRWDEFTEMKYQMLKRTGTIHAPWVIIRGDNKHQARLNAMKVILNSGPYAKQDTKLDLVPDPDIVVSGAREIERLEAELLRNKKLLC